MEAILKPDELHKISDDAEMAELKAALAKRKQAEHSQDELRHTFMARDIAAEAPARINAAIKTAAQRGLREIQVLRFPASYCNDGGRSINNFEPDWHKSLEGFAQRAYGYYEKELAPLGFKLRAEIASFPNGVPGDVALYLRW
jgi:hypothetical protein